ncbi:hypothetical protein BJY01DRAFT_213254 [Aspergillus pseudoustus]|uniref:Uncharacterized protein n=1 Tax=Aspergillus pseudoustus TaxID=1810923 RepID=A0ABR4K338_9EURO
MPRFGGEGNISLPGTSYLLGPCRSEEAERGLHSPGPRRTEPALPGTVHCIRPKRTTGIMT